MLTSSPVEKEKKASLPPADFDAILKQADLILEKKYEMVTITLTGELTSEQFLALAAKIQTIENEWKSSVNFNEYKTYDLIDKSVTDKTKSDYQLEKEFDEMKAQGRQWNLKVEATGDSPALVNFIVSQLQAKRIWSLTLHQLFSEKSFERLIYACTHSAIGVLMFGCQKQIVTDAQGKMLAECMSSGSLRYINGLPGKEFSQETAEQFVAAARNKHLIGMKDCPHYHKRQQIEWTIDDIRTTLTFGLSNLAFRTDDIVRLTEKLIDSPNPIQFCLSQGTYTDPQWITFFAKVLSSKTNVTELTISNSVEISDEVMLAIATAMGLNTTVKGLTIYKFLNHIIANALTSSFKLNKTLANVEVRINDREDVTNIIESLTSHPSLVSLMLNGSMCRGQGKAFQQLLSQTTSLQKLYLINTISDDDTLTGIVEGLEQNNTLKELYLTGNIFSDKGLIRLADTLPKNQKLTGICFHTNAHSYSIAGVEYFVSQLQWNKSIVNVGLAYTTVNDEKIEPIKTLLNATIERNEQLAKQRHFEWEMEYKQPYVETAILLFQAHRQNIGWKAMVILEKTLAFLAPDPSIVKPAQTQRCTDLIRNNLFNRKWKTTLDVKVSPYGSQETRAFTIFEKWPGRTVTFGKNKGTEKNNQISNTNF